MPTLTTSGSPTFAGGACLIDTTGSDRVYTTGAGVGVAVAQGWVAIRLRMKVANTSFAAAPYVFFWGPEPHGGHYIALLYNPTLTRWEVNRIQASDGTSGANVTDTFAADTYVTLIAAWTATGVKLSLDGAAFATASNSRNPTISGANPADFGSIQGQATGRQINAEVYWAAAGSGTLTDGNAATLHGFGNTDPAWGSLPGTPTFLWYADDATYLDAAPPGPTAAFSGTPTTGPAPLTVQFTDESTGTPTAWAWDFGDTNTSTDQNPEHEYTAPGSYDVELEVTSAGGSDDELKAGYITVTAPEPGIEGFSVAFDDPTLEPDPTWTRLA
jgi:PKD repeat protein